MEAPKRKVEEAGWGLASGETTSAGGDRGSNLLFYLFAHLFFRGFVVAAHRFLLPTSSKQYGRARRVGAGAVVRAPWTGGAERRSGGRKSPGAGTGGM